MVYDSFAYGRAHAGTDFDDLANTEECSYGKATDAAQPSPSSTHNKAPYTSLARSHTYPCKDFRDPPLKR